MAYTGCGLRSMRTVVEGYVLNHAPNTKVIGSNVPMGYFHIPGADARDYVASSVEQSKGFQYDKANGFWADGLPQNFSTMLETAGFPRLQESGWDSLGLYQPSCEGWGGPAPPTEGDVAWTVDNPTYQANLDSLERFIETLAAKGIHLLFYTVPQSPYYVDTDNYYRGGPSWTTGRKIMEDMRKLETTHSNFHVYDGYLDGKHDFGDAEAYNWNHLCRTGASRFAGKLDSVLTSLGL
jgi:hypothetical protein